MAAGGWRKEALGPLVLGWCLKKKLGRGLTCPRSPSGRRQACRRCARRPRRIRYVSTGHRIGAYANSTGHRIGEYATSVPDIATYATSVPDTA
eukprot:656571-Rhodomonas_salina.3